MVDQSSDLTLISPWSRIGLKSLGITIDICGSTGLSTVYERRGEPIPNVVRQAWLDLEIFYRSLGEMEDLEMLVLRFKSKEAKQFEDDGKKARNLSWLSRLEKLKELRHVPAVRTKTSKTVSRKELEWTLEHLCVAGSRVCKL
ncbi:MAG: hypothetical protein JOS17DRAFT_791929 [Linnemannia elongata]|nr:MAG: hypothetical protein JOS17DRAFT_791929 [Linnemannia elongata]